MLTTYVKNKKLSGEVKVISSGSLKLPESKFVSINHCNSGFYICTF